MFYVDIPISVDGKCGNKIPSAWRLERVCWKLFGRWQGFFPVYLLDP